MRPLVVLLGIVMGSTVSIATALLLTGVVFLLLPEYGARLADESRSLTTGCVLSVLLAAIASASFYGELLPIDFAGPTRRVRPSTRLRRDSRAMTYYECQACKFEQAARLGLSVVRAACATARGRLYPGRCCMGRSPVALPLETGSHLTA